MTLEHGVEPVIGWRVWNLSDDEADGPVLWPAGSGTDRGHVAARSKLDAPCRACSPGVAAATTRPASTADAASMRATRSRWSRGNVLPGSRPR